MKKFTSILILLFIPIVISYIGLFLSSHVPAQAGSSENVAGWAWSETIGWISFNNTSGGGGVSYGVHVDPVTGTMTGYAWAEHIGWIKFDPAGPYPSSPNNSVKVNVSDGSVSGWARACAGAANADCSGGTHLNSGGWDGWVKFKKDAADTGSSYGITLDIPTGDFHGWAWGGEVVGWISFNCAEGGALGENICSASNYKVSTIPNVFNAPPQATNLSDNSGSANYCGSSSPPIVLSWQFSDPGDTQSAYQVQVDNNSDFSSPEKDSGKVISSSVQYAPPGLSFNTTYYWRLMVWDAGGSASSWTNAPASFTTASHQYPTPDFTWTPKNAGINEKVFFTDTSIAYGGASKSSFSWTFQDGSPPTSTKQNPDVVFTLPGDKAVSQSVTDSDGFQCTGTKILRVSLPFPGWEEISPF